MNDLAVAEQIQVELCEHAAELIARKSKDGQRALLIDWLSGTC